MLKRRRQVFLDKGMRRPGKTVTDDWRHQQPANLETDHRLEDAQKCQNGAADMQKPGFALAMGAEIMRPEFGEGFIFLRFGHNSPVPPHYRLRSIAILL